MRYVLIFAGLCCVLLGLGFVFEGSPSQRANGESIIYVGGLIMAIGLATFDIVRAVKANRK